MAGCHVEGLGFHLASIDNVVEKLLPHTGLAAGFIPSLARRIRFEWTTFRVLVINGTDRLKTKVVGSICRNWSDRFDPFSHFSLRFRSFQSGLWLSPSLASWPLRSAAGVSSPRCSRRCPCPRNSLNRGKLRSFSYHLHVCNVFHLAKLTWNPSTLYPFCQSLSIYLL